MEKVMPREVAKDGIKVIPKLLKLMDDSTKGPEFSRKPINEQVSITTSILHAKENMLSLQEDLEAFILSEEPELKLSLTQTKTCAYIGSLMQVVDICYMIKTLKEVL